MTVGVSSSHLCLQVRIVLEDVEGLYSADPEGLSIASRINQHLPPSVQVRVLLQHIRGRTSEQARKRADILDGWVDGWMTLGLR